MAYELVKNLSVAVKTALGDWQFIGVNEGAKTTLKADELARKQLSSQQGALKSAHHKYSWDKTFASEAKGGGLDELGLLLPPECDALFRGCGMICRLGFEIPIKNIVGAAGLVYGDTVNNTTASHALGTIFDMTATTILVIAESLPTPPVNNDVLTFGNGTTAAVDGVPEETRVYFRTSKVTEMETLDFRFIEDSRQKLTTKARGSFKYTTDGFALFDFNFSGLYVENPSNVTPLDPIVSTMSPPIVDGARVFIGNWNLSTGDVALQKFDFDLGNKVELLPAQNRSNGVAAVSISDFTPTGNISFTVPPYATFNPFEMLKAGVTVRLSHSIGSEAGNKITVVVPQAQFDIPDDSGNTVGNATYNLKYSARRDPNNVKPVVYYRFS